MNLPVDPLRMGEGRQLERAREVIGRLSVERETYARLCVCLVRCLRGEVELGELEGHVVVPAAMFDAVPGQFRIGAERRMLDVAAEEGEESEEVESVEGVVLRIAVSEGGNGLAVPRGPGLVIP